MQYQYRKINADVLSDTPKDDPSENKNDSYNDNFLSEQHFNEVNVYLMLSNSYSNINNEEIEYEPISTTAPQIRE